jgi:transposase
LASLTKKIIKGRAYYYLRECQRVNGKPKIIWQKYLGPADQFIERLRNPSPQKVVLREFGASAACMNIARRLNIIDVIDRHVPKRKIEGLSVGQYMCLAALNRCIAPASKIKMASWHKGSVLSRLLPAKESQLTSQRFWDNMDRVDEEAIQAIERDLSAIAVRDFGLDLRCLLFDATNFFTFIDSFNNRSELAQRGKSKEGRSNLRLLGLALLVTSDGDVPLFHHIYEGNRHDSVTFGNVSDELASRCRKLAGDVCDITLVFDKGNNSEENLAKVEAGPYHFVGSLVPTHHAELLAIARSQMRRLDTAQLPEVWSFRTEKEVFGVKRTVLVTFNKKLFQAQYKTLIREIAKRKRKLERITHRLDRHMTGAAKGKKPTVAGTTKRVEALLAARYMKDLFKVRVKMRKCGVPSLSWRFRRDEWQSLKRTLLGKTILFTDRAKWTDEQIVRAYRSQSHVEAAFRRMKDPRFLTFRPTFHWTDQKLRVHACYCVLALMILSLLRRELEKAGIPMSIAAMMDSLVNIREVSLLYGNGRDADVTTVLSDMDDIQMRIVKALNLSLPAKVRP